MQYMVTDLEWNGSYSKKAHGYFNEIIEIGAVKLDERMREIGRFRAVIKPVVSRKLTEFVSDLTSITEKELEEGTSFPSAVAAWQQFAGEQPLTVMTWSMTDLSVLLENYRYFLHLDRVPFMGAYVDLQAYVQAHDKLGSAGQQIGLARAAAALGIPEEGFAQHRALDDSLMTAAIAQKTYEPQAFAAFIRQTDDKFYDRLNFKAYYIHDIDSPLIPRHHLRFRCPQCHRVLRRRGEWRSYANAFWADMTCRPCAAEYTARAQFRKKYDSLEVKRKLTEKPSENTKRGEDTNGKEKV